LTTELVVQQTRDALLLARLHFATVSVAYRSFFSPDSAPPNVPELTATWEARLEDPSSRALLAGRSGEPVGAVAVRRDPDYPGEGQLLGLHVLPGAWGVGVGSALHDAALDVLRSRSYEQAGLWVIAANSRARAMYEAQGWLLRAGSESDFVGVTEVRYVKGLDGLRRPIP
jgi:ribosomal protein S18 acetylase RimI-like enzyme